MEHLRQAARRDADGVRLKFPDALERERSRLQLSRHVIADQCGVSARTVRQWGSGEAVPSVRQFKRLVGIMSRVATSPPEWDAPAVAADDRAEATQEAALPSAEPGRPPIQPFHLGLRRIREDNEISQDELGALLGLTGQAVAAWENAINVPVEENLAKLVSALPELQYGFELGAIARPPSQDIPVPSGGSGLHRVVFGIPTSPAAPQRAQDGTLSQQPAAPETPVASGVPSTVAALAEAHARARVRLARAKVAEAAAEEGLRLAAAQRIAAAREVDETLQLLELAVQEEEGTQAHG